jgi:hypothetical protein
VAHGLMSVLGFKVDDMAYLMGTSAREDRGYSFRHGPRLKLFRFEVLGLSVVSKPSAWKERVQQ